MAYAVQRDEALPDSVRRIMNEQIARAMEHLTDEGAGIEKRVHDARKRIKEIRALLRMIREPLGGQYALENAWFRDTGRELAGPRDAAAVLESLSALAKVRKLPRTITRRTRALLAARRDAMAREHLPERIESVLERLRVAQARAGLWPAIDDSFGSIEGGLLRMHRRGRSAMRTAAASGMPRDFHEWRKVAKVQWYHALLLRHIWPEMMKAWAGVLEDLSRALGDHHDLFVLRQIVATTHPQLGRRGAVVSLLDAIASRQTQLEEQALRIGALVYAERPRAWLARIRNSWDAWRA